MRIGDAWQYTHGFDRRQITNGLSILTPITQYGEQIVTSISDCMELKPIKRIWQKYAYSTDDGRIVKNLEDESKSVWDAVNIYNNVNITEFAKRQISHLLSLNDTVFLTVKRILKK